MYFTKLTAWTHIFTNTAHLLSCSHAVNYQICNKLLWSLQRYYGHQATFFVVIDLNTEYNRDAIGKITDSLLQKFVGKFLKRFAEIIDLCGTFMKHNSR